MKYAGMTVNERLYLSGLLKEYDKAISERNIDKVKAILEKVELNENSIEAILLAHGLKSKEED